MATVSEHSLDDDTAAVFAFASRQCLALLGLAADDDPKKIVQSVDAIADAWQQGWRAPPDVLDTTDAPYVFGSAWGDQLVRAFGWEWAVLQWDGEKWPAVRSDDRSLAVYPFAYLGECFDNPQEDITIALAFNMIAADKVGSRQPGEYFDLMSAVRRIVPRR